LTAIVSLYLVVFFYAAFAGAGLLLVIPLAFTLLAYLAVFFAVRELLLWYRYLRSTR